jgi:peroxiredoxin
MRLSRLFCVAVLAVFVSAPLAAEEKAAPAKQAPKVVLKSADGKKTYDLEKLTAEGPVLVRLTCACSGCDAELPYFQALQSAYQGKGLKTLAVFREQPEAAENYTTEKGVKFFWISDPKGELWKTFDATAMPTNVLIDKGGSVVKVLPGCQKDGKNAQVLSGEIAKLLKTEPVKIETAGAKKTEDKK